MVHNNQGRQKKKRKTGCLILILIALFLVAVLGVGYLIANNEINGNRGLGEEPVAVAIAEGAATTSIAESLSENNVINSQLVFRLYCRFKDVAGTFHSGEHSFTPNMTYDEIIAVLQTPVVIEDPHTVVTFPEGTTTLKMAMMLEELGLCTIDEFVDACNNDTFNVPFYSEIKDDPNIFIKLEGYLFPDTYKYYDHWTVHDFIQSMLENFDAVIMQSALGDQIANSEYSLHQIVTMAALIEKESFGGEHYNVSSVFYNRLKPESPVTLLQSDTTWNYIAYVLDYYYDGNTPESMSLAYDSYKTPGFIVGPTCNPGYTSIDASVNPADTPYYYFLTDNNKKFYWAETYAEHDQNVQTMKQVNAGLAEAGEE